MSEQGIEVHEVVDPRVIAARIASKIAKISKEVVAKARSVLEVRGMCSPIRPHTVYAVDSAYPSRATDLVGLSVSLIAVVLARYREGERVETRTVRRLLVSYFSEIEQDRVAAFARKEERIIALSAATDADILLIDGEIVPYKRAQSHWREPITLSIVLLEKLQRKGIPLVGVIKRSYSSELARKLGLGLNDKSIASLVLRRGEFVEVEPSLKILREHGCKIVYYKPLRGLGEAVKLEACIPEGSLNMCGIVSYLAREAGPSGLPWIIDLVDSLAKRNVSLIEAIRGSLLSKLAIHTGENIVVGYPTNPQEKRLSYKE